MKTGWWSRSPVRAGASVSPEENKASRTAQVVSLHEIGRPRWTPRDYTMLAREGFSKNPVVHRCIRLIAESVASVPLLAFERAEEKPDHAALKLLKRPNPAQSGKVLLETLVGHLLMSGNAYLETVSLGGSLAELYALRPDRMKIIPGRDGWPDGFEYSVGGRAVRFERDFETGFLPILHLKLFHALDDHYGLPPLEAAQMALDIHNAAAGWNKALLDNAARPSGALIYGAGTQAHLSDTQFERLKEELEQGFQGARNAGRPMLLEGGLEWRAMSLSPRDMDFMEAKNGAARDIALAFGVPPMLLGLPGDNTYANYQEANRAFWRQTVLPMLGRILDSYAAWLEPVLGGEALRLEPDLDQVVALGPERDWLWQRVSQASFLTDEEKREALGYGSKT
jgi:HK97 family phage portal protein